MHPEGIDYTYLQIHIVNRTHKNNHTSKALLVMQNYFCQRKAFPTFACTSLWTNMQHFLTPPSLIMIGSVYYRGTGQTLRWLRRLWKGEWIKKDMIMLLCETCRRFSNWVFDSQLSWWSSCAHYLKRALQLIHLGLVPKHKLWEQQESNLIGNL